MVYDSYDYRINPLTFFKYNISSFGNIILVLHLIIKEGTEYLSMRVESHDNTFHLFITSPTHAVIIYTKWFLVLMIKEISNNS